MKEKNLLKEGEKTKLLKKRKKTPLKKKKRKIYNIVKKTSEQKENLVKKQ